MPTGVYVRKPRPPKFTVEERFWSYVDKRGEDETWPWKGGRNKDDYGVFTPVHGHKQWLAHRYMYELIIGKIPHGMLVCHTCDVPACVNPKHLFLGDQKDNANDMIRKGRGLIGDRTHFAKLTWEKVKMIREYHKMGRTRLELAAEFGVTRENIGYIVQNTTWKSSTS